MLLFSVIVKFDIQVTVPSTGNSFDTFAKKLGSLLYWDNQLYDHPPVAVVNSLYL